MDPFSAALREIATIPGARYSCVADDVTGDVLAEHGHPGPDPAAAVRWGCGLRAALRPHGEFEDVMITAEHTYHLLRLVRAESRTVLVHLSVDRARSTLAAARRALGDLRLDGTDPPVPQRVYDHHPRAADAMPAAVPEQRTPMPSTVALPVRTPRRPGPSPARPVRGPGATLSAVAPPRRPATPTTAPAPPPESAPPEQPVSVPIARGWSDDLYTMGRLLDALRRMQ